jgi:DNA-directed RNA polymerase subunit omega
MLEELKEDEIVNKVGGRFKLATLIQKRLIAINQGSRELVDARTRDRMSVVISEIMNDKIFLDTSGKSQTLHEAPESDDGGTVDLTQDD